MKNLFSVAILAAAFTLASCGSASVDKVADCFCESINGLAKYKKEMDDTAVPEDKKAEIRIKMFGHLMKNEKCTQDLQAELEKLSDEEKTKFATEVQEKITKSCLNLELLTK